MTTLGLIRAGLGLAVGLLPAALAGCSKPASAERVPPPVEVAVVEARSMTVPIMAEPIGTTTPLQEVSIRARVRGFLKEIHFAEGADVKAGQLLFVIDEEPFQAKLAEAQADLAQAEADAARRETRRPGRSRQAQVAVDQAIGRAGQDRGAARASRPLRAERGGDRRGRRQGQPPSGRGRGAARGRQGQPRPGQGRLRDGHPRRPGRRRGGRRPGSSTRRSTWATAGCPRRSTGGSAWSRSSSATSSAPGGPSGGARRPDTPSSASSASSTRSGVDIQVASRYLDRVTRLIAQGLADIEVFRPGIEGERRRRLPGQATVDRQHGQPDDLHVPGPGRGRQPIEGAPARRVREGQRQGRRGQGRDRRPRAGGGRVAGRPDGLHGRRPGEGRRHARSRRPSSTRASASSNRASSPARR